jgi:hypothetical protein
LRDQLDQDGTPSASQAGHTSLYSRPSLADAISSHLAQYPAGGESYWRLTWYDFPSTKVVAGNFFMPAANYRGVGVEMPMS